MATIISPTYEVETRFYFLNLDEVWKRLPMFQPYVHQEVQWNTIHYGPTLFRTDRILRINHTIRQGKTYSSLGWKEPEQGKSVNIRMEIEEDITDGIKGSTILAGLNGKTDLSTTESVSAELVRLGHPDFMAFTGKNLTGEYVQRNFHLKLMLSSNPPLRYPLLFEVEKTARSFEEAAAFERELLEFIRQNSLEDRVLREEPPALLFQTLNL